MCDQGLEGTSSGWSSPARGRLKPLPAAQTRQADTNQQEFRNMDGHQNCSLIKLQIRVASEWQASMNEWPHCRMLVQTDSDTNSRLSGHPAGTVTLCSAVRTSQSGGRMVTGRMDPGSASKIHESVSAYLRCRRVDL